MHRAIAAKEPALFLTQKRCRLFCGRLKQEFPCQRQLFRLYRLLGKRYSRTKCQAPSQRRRWVDRQPSAIDGGASASAESNQCRIQPGRRQPATDRRTYDPTRNEQVFATLRREILAARLNVTHRRAAGPSDVCDGEARLAGMKLSPTVRPYFRGRDVPAGAAAPVTSREGGAEEIR